MENFDYFAKSHKLIDSIYKLKINNDEKKLLKEINSATSLSSFELLLESYKKNNYDIISNIKNKKSLLIDKSFKRDDKNIIKSIINAIGEGINEASLSNLEEEISLREKNSLYY